MRAAEKLSEQSRWLRWTSRDVRGVRVQVACGPEGMMRRSVERDRISGQDSKRDGDTQCLKVYHSGKTAAEARMLQ